MHQPRKTFALVGRTFRRKNRDEPKETPTNLELLERVKSYVAFQFDAYPLLITNYSDLINDENEYPEFFAASLYISDLPISGETGHYSALVILEHGRTMSEATEELTKTFDRVNWESKAETLNWTRNL